MIKLSPREAECIVRYLKEGRLKPVAEQMGVSIYTARRQKENAMRKLGATNSAELFSLALKRGLVDLK